MLKHFLILSMAAAITVSLGYAGQATTNATAPVKMTDPSSGKQMYTNYCASCHGVDGRGSGPAASALKVQPVDLTVLSKNNGGKFPGNHIVSVLNMGSAIPSHGSLDMPVWGPVFGKMGGMNPESRTIRISNLSRYLQSIQVK